MYNIISNLQNENEILNIYDKIKDYYNLRIKKYNKEPLGIRKIGMLILLKFNKNLMYCKIMYRMMIQ